jgi:hypothetical protein
MMVSGVDSTMCNAVVDGARSAVAAAENGELAKDCTLAIRAAVEEKAPAPPPRPLR